MKTKKGIFRIAIGLPLTLIYFMLISCENKEPQASADSSEIFSIIYDTLAKEIPAPFPPLPDDHTRNDSLRINEKVQEYRSARENRNMVVAIHPFLIAGTQVEDFGSMENPAFHKLLIQLKNLKENKPFHTAMVKTTRTDSIIEFRTELQYNEKKDFEQIDRFITFSRLVFNENKTEAALIASSSKSRLAGFSAAYFLKKEADKWVLVESKGLSIF